MCDGINPLLDVATDVLDLPWDVTERKVHAEHRRRLPGERQGGENDEDGQQGIMGHERPLGSVASASCRQVPPRWCRDIVQPTTGQYANAILPSLRGKPACPLPAPLTVAPSAGSLLLWLSPPGPPRPYA